MRYSIVIPAYNEGARIATSLDRILRHAADCQWDAEILVVDDGSSDNTAELVRFAVENRVVESTLNEMRFALSS